MSRPSSLPKRLPPNPGDRLMRRVWGDSGWRSVDDAEHECEATGDWVPTGVQYGERLVVRHAHPPAVDFGVGCFARSPATWFVLLDGAMMRESDGSPLTWPDRFAAGYDALVALRNHWYGPDHRFSPSEPWGNFQGFLMRLLTGAYLSGSGDALRLESNTPVAVIRQWHWPYPDQWGVFVGSGQRYCLQTIGGVQGFKSAAAAFTAANHEVGRWRVSHELRPTNRMGLHGMPSTHGPNAA